MSLSPRPTRARLAAAALVATSVLAACQGGGTGGSDSAAAAADTAVAANEARLKQVDDSVNNLLSLLAAQTDTLKRAVEAREVRLEDMASKNPDALARLTTFVGEFRTMQATLRAKDDTIKALRLQVDSLIKERDMWKGKYEALLKRYRSLQGRATKFAETEKKTKQKLDSTTKVVDSVVTVVRTGYVLVATRQELVDKGIAGKTNRFGLGRIVLKTVDPSQLTKVNTADTKDIELGADAGKVEVLSAHPTGSYTLVGTMLKVTDPDAFWGSTRVLVVMTP